MTVPVVSEARIPVAENQEVDFEMLTNMGLMAQGSIDNLIANCIGPGIGYVGLACTAKVNAQSNTSTLVTIGTGWMKRGGKAYALRDPDDIDLASVINTVPAGKTAIVLILADGQEAPVEGQITVLNAALEPPDPNAYWPTKIIDGDTAIVRSVIPTKVAGVPDLQPQPPAANPNYCLLATCIVDNGTILSVTQETAQQITPLDQLAPIVASVRGQVSTYGALIASLLSTVAGLSARQDSQYATLLAAITALQARMTALETKTTAGSSSITTWTDFFTDGVQLNPGVGSSFKVGSGLTFSGAGQELPLYPVNPYAAGLKLISDRYLTLDYTTGADRQAGTFLGFTIPMNGLAPWSTGLNRRGFGRLRSQYGASLPQASVPQLLLNGDPAQIFDHNPSAHPYDPTWGRWQDYKPELVRNAGFWRSLTGRDNWATQIALAAVSAVPALDEVVNPTTTYALTELDLKLDKGTSGDIRLIICGDLAGNPDPNAVLADITVPYAGILDNYQGSGASTARFVMPYPIAFEAGKTYHRVYLSTGNHQLHLVFTDAHDGRAFANGTLQQLANGGWYPRNDGRGLEYTLYYAQYPTTAVTVDLKPIALAGGLDLLDIAASVLMPPGGNVRFGLKTGGNTYQYLDSTAGLLNGNPSTVTPFMRIDAGTNAVLAPVIDLNTFNSATTKQTGSFTVPSVTYTATASVTHITESVILSGFNGTYETYTDTLLTGVGLATTTAPTTVQDKVQGDGTLLRTFTWVLGSGVTAWAIQRAGTTSDVIKQFTLQQAYGSASP